MNFERAPQLSGEALDRKWYERFIEIGKFEAFDYLSGDELIRKEERRQFEMGENRNPTLDYPRVEFDDFDKKDQELLALKQEILDSEKNEIVKQAWRWKLNEKIAEARMLKAVAKGDARRFSRYSEFVYGKPSLAVFAYTVASLKNEMRVMAGADNSDLAEAARELDLVLPDGLPKAEVAVLPTEETVSEAHDLTVGQLGGLIKIDGLEGELGAGDIKQTFEEALKGLKAEGWQVVITPNKTAISVIQESSTVAVPETRKLLVEKLKQLVMHEIGTHVARRLNGERSKLMLLGLGLDRYDSGEEGIATMREQAFVGEVKDYAGLVGHLSISLAKGLDGQPRDFRGVYDIMCKYYLISSLKEGKAKEEATVAAANKAWSTCVRTFRGSDCETPGACFTKDIVYREGNIGIWEVLRINPSEARRFNIGKYDPNNNRHVWVLDQLAISDQDLKDLDE